MARACRDDLPDRQSGNFFDRDWTGKIRLKGFDKFGFWRKALFGASGREIST
jgi:hypothetical protein